METFFIYGTLKKGFPNHERLGLDKTAKFLGPAELAGAKMYDLGLFPAIVMTGEPKDVVQGELYNIEDEECINRIRRMERAAGYDEVEVDIGGTKAKAFVFDHVPQKASHVEDGKWIQASITSRWIRMICKTDL